MFGPYFLFLLIPFLSPEIVFLRSIIPSHYPHVDSPEIVYDIQEGNIQNSFDIVKRLEHGMIVGKWHSGICLTMPYDHKLNPGAQFSGNLICLKWFPDLILHYERFSWLFFLQTNCICVLVWERGTRRLRGLETACRCLFHLGDHDTTLPTLVQLMIGLSGLLHLLWSL